MDVALRAKGTFASIFEAINLLIRLVGLLFLSFWSSHKVLEFYLNNLVVEGQRCQYTGTFSGVLESLVGHYLLLFVTCGIYAPWYLCKAINYGYENTVVSGQRGRLSFHGDGASFIGRFILGNLLTQCTLGIYGAWFMNDLFAFVWENTCIDKRPFAFRKDPGGFLGPYLLNNLLSFCTFGIYSPWTIANYAKWSTEHVS